MANRLFYCLRRASLTSLFKFSPSNSPPFGSFVHLSQSILYPSQDFLYVSVWRPSWVFRKLSHGSVNLVISHGKPKFETHEIEPPKKDKWKTKKRLKLQRKREKQKRKSANKRDPRLLGVKGKKKKQKFPNAEARIRDKIEKAKIKEALLIERLKRYEVPKLQGPEIEPDNLTGEERFYMKKMAQKRSNYVPVGRRGVFGGVILNMHLHWKKHETVKVICKPCKPGQVRDYANEIARLSGGIPIQIIGNDTIIFYRGKNYFQPKVMSPIDTLSKKRALEKSKYEQSLESVRRFIAIAEKELELYYRHVALYGDPNNRDSISTLTDSGRGSGELRESKTIEGEYHELTSDGSFSTYFSEGEEDFTGGEISENGHEEDEDFEGSEVDLEDEDLTSTDCNYRESSFTVEEMPLSYLGSSIKGHAWVSNNQDLVIRRFQTDEN